MITIPSSTLGALISQDLLLLADALSGASCDEQDRLLTTIKLDLNIDLATATTDEVVAKAEELRQFQIKYQEYVLDIISRKRQMEMESYTKSSSINFRQKLGAFLIICSLIYVICLTWIPIVEANQRFADTALGFILATVMSTIINFFYGTSENNNNNFPSSRNDSIQEPKRPKSNRME